LNLKTFCIDIDETGELGNPNHTIAGKISNVHSAIIGAR
jgi:hypothetical protein